jgi:hypothetical protein
VLLESLEAPDTLDRMAATADTGSEEHVNAVVEGLVRQHDMSALGRKRTPFDTDDLT